MFLDSWPARSVLVAAFGVVVLVSACLLLLQLVASFHNRIGFGAWGYWSVPDDCYLISPATPSSWPAFKDGTLLSSDCIATIDGVSIAEYKDKTNLLLTWFLLDASPDQMLTVGISRNGEHAVVEVASLRLTLTRLLEGILALVIPGLTWWVLAWAVLAARPDAEENLVLALLLFLGAQLLLTNTTGLYRGLAYQLHGWLFAWAARPFLGALLFQIAFLFPEPFVSRPLRRWRFTLHPLALLSCLLSAVVFLGAERIGAWSKPLHLSNNALIAFIFLVGSLVFFGRSLVISRRSSSLRSKHQANLLMFSLLGVVPIVATHMILIELRLPWIVPAVSNSTFIYWMIPTAALLTYAMLRYQTFAYRGYALTVLIVVMVSAALTQIYSFFINPRGWDGVQFATIWGAVLLATLFWFVDSPLRRSFRRLFVRHEFDFQITDRFSHEMAATRGVDDALARSVSALRDNLEVAWVAVTSAFRPGRLWLAEAEKPVSATLAVADGPPEAVLPGPPALTHSLDDGDQPMGMILLGHRTTAEPLDDKDRQLIALLGHELTRTLSVHAHIENLEQVPGRILAAVDADRSRIGQDLHDSVLQFLGAIPLELDRAIRLADHDPAQVRAILDRAIDQAEIVSQETRASVYDLSPPLLLRHGVADAARAYAEHACTRTGVQLRWSVDSEPVWRQLPETQATQVYRIVQQAVDNALAHARPTVLSVRFERGEEDLFVQVSDDGVGFDPASSLLTSQVSPQEARLGYISMQARAKALAGTLIVRSSPGVGTTITLRFPPV